MSEFGKIDERPRQLAGRTLRALEVTDAMPAELRACVHELGWAIVREFLGCGIKDPQRIRRLTHAAWAGARSVGDRTGRKGHKGHRSPILDRLDWFLIQNASPIGAETLVRLLWLSNTAIFPVSPSEAMIEASMDAVSPADGLMSKHEKHKRRLLAALRAQVHMTWPHLFADKAA
jgi:hypothetical protein